MVTMSNPGRLFSRSPRRVDRSNPFPGARPFVEDERGLFRGRRSEIAELASIVQTQRFCLLYAPSGAGKSSLINAGLLPALTSKDAGQQIDVVGVAKVHPGSVRGPSGWPPKSSVDNVYVTAALNSLDPVERSPHAELVPFFVERRVKLDEYGDPIPRLLVLDQFEEILEPFAREDWIDCRNGFFDQLDEAFDIDDSLHVLIALREDHFATIERLTCDMRTAPRARYRLDKLKWSRALLAMEEPAAASGLPFDDGVAAELLKELARRPIDDLEDGIPDEFIEPGQLQVVCNRLWAKADVDRTKGGDDGARIRADHVAQMGGAVGSLRQYYEEAMSTVPKGFRQRRLRAFFESRLIGKGGTRQLVPIGPDGTTKKVPNSSLEQLESEFGLVRTERRGGTAYWELSHDGFIQPIRASNNDRRTARLKATRWAVIIGFVLAYVVALSLRSLLGPDDGDETASVATSVVEQFEVPRLFGDPTPVVPIGPRAAGARLVVEIVQPSGADADASLLAEDGTAVPPELQAGDLAEYEIDNSTAYAVQVSLNDTSPDDALGINVRPDASLITLPDVIGEDSQLAASTLGEAGLYVNGVRSVCSDFDGLVLGETIRVIDLDRQAVPGVDGVLDAFGDPRFALGDRSGVMVAGGTTVVIEAFDGRSCAEATSGESSTDG